MEGAVQDCSDYGFGSSVHEVDGRSSSQLMTNSDTSSAENTQIIIPVEKRIVLFDIQVPIDGRKIDFVELYSFDDIL
jgi:hypothetical protein